jgi:hypothetical protein
LTAPGIAVTLSSMRHSRVGLIMLVCTIGLISSEPLHAESDLQKQTATAYRDYAQQAEEAFLARVRAGGPQAPRPDGVIAARPGRDDGIISVPGGLVHHWIASAFLPGASLQDVLKLSRDYEKYASIYRAIVSAKLLEHEGDTYRTALRLKEGEAGITAVLQVRSTIRYIAANEHSVYSISTADEIREVKNAGSRNEELLPAGRDSGYLWRAQVFNWFVQREDGVYLETETLGLSRGFPPFIGWFIEPIARRLGRKSVESSLLQFRSALTCATKHSAEYDCAAGK